MSARRPTSEDIKPHRSSSAELGIVGARMTAVTFTWAGLPGEVVKAMGDWRTAAYFSYWPWLSNFYNVLHIIKVKLPENAHQFTSSHMDAFTSIIVWGKYRKIMKNCCEFWYTCKVVCDAGNLCKFCCQNILSESGENGSRSERVGECMGVQPCVSESVCGSSCLDQSSIIKVVEWRDGDRRGEGGVWKL